MKHHQKPKSPQEGDFRYTFGAVQVWTEKGRALDYKRFKSFYDLPGCTSKGDGWTTIATLEHHEHLEVEARPYDPKKEYHARIVPALQACRRIPKTALEAGAIETLITTLQGLLAFAQAYGVSERASYTDWSGHFEAAESVLASIGRSL